MAGVYKGGKKAGLRLPDAEKIFFCTGAKSNFTTKSIVKIPVSVALLFADMLLFSVKTLLWERANLLLMLKGKEAIFGSVEKAQRFSLESFITRLFETKTRINFHNPPSTETLFRT